MMTRNGLTHENRSGWTRRILRWAGIAVLALAAVYLAGANLILNTDLLNPVLFRKPEKLLVEWRSGWTVVPGFVHVEGLRIRGQPKRMQWQCRLEEADVRLSLLAFASKRVRIRRAHGTGFEFYLRKRLTEETRDDPNARHTPEIEGFSNPPDPVPEDIYPPKKKNKRPWHIEVSDVRLASRGRWTCGSASCGSRAGAWSGATSTSGSAGPCTCRGRSSTSRPAS